METILFFIVIFCAFFLQGITGFAGSILAMMPCIELVSYEVAKPIINIIGLFAGAYIVILDFKYIDFKQMKKITIFMLVGVVIGAVVYRYNLISINMLYFAFIFFVAYVGVTGLIFSKKEAKEYNKYSSILIPIFSGIIHVIFNTGGIVLVGYASTIIFDKKIFRATLSFIWVVINGTIIISDSINGLITQKVLIMSVISLPVLCAAMFVGNIVYKYIKPSYFKKLTYILLICIAAFVFIFR